MMQHLVSGVHSGPHWSFNTRLQSVSTRSAGSDPVCLVIGIRWVAAKARQPGFSGTHSNMEAFILWKRCLVKVQHCSLQPSPSNDSPVLLPRRGDGALWWIWLVKHGHTHTYTHTLPSLCTVMDMTGESSEHCFLSPSLPSSQAWVSQAEPGFTRLGPDWIAD